MRSEEKMDRILINFECVNRFTDQSFAITQNTILIDNFKLHLLAEHGINNF